MKTGNLLFLHSKDVWTPKFPCTDRWVQRTANWANIKLAVDS